MKLSRIVLFDPLNPMPEIENRSITAPNTSFDRMSVSEIQTGKRVLSGRCVLAGGETGPYRCRCEDRGPKPAETLAASGRPAYTGVGIEESKRKSWFR